MRHFSIKPLNYCPKNVKIFLTASKIDWFKFGKTQLLFSSFRWIVQHQKWKVLVSHVWLFVTPQTVTCQVPLSIDFSRQEYWSGSHSLLQGIFLTQGSNSGFLHCRQTLPSESQGKPTTSKTLPSSYLESALSQKTSKFKKKCYQFTAWKTEFLFKYSKMFYICWRITSARVEKVKSYPGRWYFSHTKIF